MEKISDIFTAEVVSIPEQKEVPLQMIATALEKYVQQRRRESAEELLRAIDDGRITDIRDVDPRLSSPEVVQMARRKLVEKGHLPRKEITSGL